MRLSKEDTGVSSPRRGNIDTRKSPGRRASTGSSPEVCDAPLPLSPDKGGALYKRKDFLGDSDALSHPNRTYFFKKTFDVDEIIDSSTRRLREDPNDVNSLFLRGLASFKKGDHGTAVIDLQSLLSKDPHHVEGLYTRGLAYSRMKKDEQAIDDFSQVLYLDPDHINAAFARAASYNSIGQFARAIEDYNFALLKDTSVSNSPGRGIINGGADNEGPRIGDRPGALVDSAGGFAISESLGAGLNSPPKRPADPLSSSSSSSNRLDDAIDSLSTLSVSSQAAAADHHSRGYALRKEGNFSGAVEEYSKAIAIDPGYFKAFFNRGFALDKLGKLQEAAEDYSSALAIEPDNAYAYYNRGITLDRSCELARAHEDFSRAIELLPDNSDFFHNRAFCSRKMGRLEDAVADYDMSLSLSPFHLKALYNRAYCYEQLGRLFEAMGDYCTVLDKDPRHSGALSNRALLRERLGDSGGALEDFGTALHCGAPVAATKGSMAKVLTKMGRFDEAAKVLTEAIGAQQAEGAADAELYFLRGVCHKNRERYEEALGDYTRAILGSEGSTEGAEARSTQASYFTHRGYCLRKLQRYEEALGDYALAMRLVPDMVRAINNRAYCYSRLGRRAEAIADYTTVISLDQTNSHAYHNRAIALEAEGRREEAQRDFAKVLEIDGGVVPPPPVAVPPLAQAAEPTVLRTLPAAQPAFVTARPRDRMSTSEYMDMVLENKPRSFKPTQA